MSSLITTETHERSHSRVVDRHELEGLVIRAILAELGLKLGDPNVEASIRFEDVREGGSCPYRVGVMAIVKVVEDLAPTSGEQ
jgi:hypothetical protein